MKTLSATALTTAALLAGTSHAADFNYNVSPADLLTDFQNGRGGEAFGFDADSGVPKSSDTDGAPGFGNSSLWSDVTGGGTARPYSAVRFSPRDMFGTTGLTLGELESISYYTNQNGGTRDWQLKIYTENEAGTSWYEYRIESEALSTSTGTWTFNSTDGNLSVGRLTDRSSGSTVDLAITAANDEFSEVFTQYGSEEILFIDVIAGWTNGPAIDSLLDGFQIELTNGDTATANFVPEPGSLALLSLSGLAMLRRRRRRA